MRYYIHFLIKCWYYWYPDRTCTPIINSTPKSKLYLTQQIQSSVSVTLMASTFTVLFSLLFLLSIPSILSHPLDPLTPLEIKQVTKIIKGARAGSLANLTFQYVGLDEPSKSTILSWLSNPTKEPPPRQAFVIARAYEKSYEFVVSLSDGSIISQHIYNGTGFPLLNLEEQSAANDLAFKYPPFIKSIKKRGLDIKDVVPSVFTVGWYGKKSMSGMLRYSFSTKVARLMFGLDLLRVLLYLWTLIRWWLWNTLIVKWYQYQKLRVLNIEVQKWGHHWQLKQSLSLLSSLMVPASWSTVTP